MSIYRQIGEPDVTNERMTHLLKLDTFFRIPDARIMTHDASQIRTTHRVNPALETICKSTLLSSLSIYNIILIIKATILNEYWRIQIVF